jgi:hypothetical protein
VVKKRRAATTTTAAKGGGVFGLVVFSVVACGKVYSEESPPLTPVKDDASIAPGDAGNNTSPDAAPSPDASADAISGDTALYYGACLSELAFQQPSKVFNIYATVTFSVDTLNLGFQFLAVTNNFEPPTNVSKLGAVGPLHSGAARGDTNGSYPLSIGTMEIPGTANPISGSDAQINASAIAVRWIGGAGIGSRFCGRLSGMVVKPVAATRELDPDMNICHFVPITEGAATPRFTAADFQSSACPKN